MRSMSKHVTEFHKEKRYIHYYYTDETYQGCTSKGSKTKSNMTAIVSSRKPRQIRTGFSRAVVRGPKPRQVWLWFYHAVVRSRKPWQIRNGFSQAVLRGPKPRQDMKVILPRCYERSWAWKATFIWISCCRIIGLKWMRYKCQVIPRMTQKNMRQFAAFLCKMVIPILFQECKLPWYRILAL